MSSTKFVEGAQI